MFALLIGLMAAASPAGAQSLAQMAGQMIVVGFKGASVDDASVSALAKGIADGTIGGVMYLKYNVKNMKAVEAMNAGFRAAAPEVAPFIAIDQEGGAVERLTAAVGFPELPSAAAIAAKNAPAEAKTRYAKMARGLADLGFSVNFGPVVDLARNPANPVIAKHGRAFGAEPGTVTEYAEAFVAAHRAAGVATALKHFPGHGSSVADSHEGFVDITRTWKVDELDPYRVLIAKGAADMVMVGHLFHAKYAGSADEHLPASLAPAWIEGVLRGELGFTGVVVSDDLEMGAIAKRFDLAETVRRAVRAGADILLFSNTADYRPSLGQEVNDILVAEAEADPAFKAKVAASYARIVALKGRLARPAL